jgi:hypothetical protein
MSNVPSTDVEVGPATNGVKKYPGSTAWPSVVHVGKQGGNVCGTSRSRSILETVLSCQSVLQRQLHNLLLSSTAFRPVSYQAFNAVRKKGCGSYQSWAVHSHAEIKL